MCDSVVGMHAFVDCPQCKGKNPNCSKCGGHGIIGVSQLMDKTPDRKPAPNPMDKVDTELHRIPR